jgi:hypothetical protein
VRRQDVTVANTGDADLKAVVSVSGAPLTPEPEAEKGFAIERLYYTLDGDAVDPSTVKQNTRLAVVLKIAEPDPHYGRVIVADSKRSLDAKLRQMVRAIEIERALSKDQVLALYLSLAPYGGNLEGIRAASLAYFGHEPRRLTIGEAALLVALPQSLEARRPDRASQAAKDARDRVLDRLEGEGFLTAAEVQRDKAEPLPTARRAMPLLAPHAAAAVAGAPDVKLHRLTIDATWQKSLEALARERARSDPTSRSRSSRLTMRAARFWREPARPIISTSAAPGRST